MDLVKIGKYIAEKTGLLENERSKHIMKIAFDVDVLAKQSMDINWMVHQVADWGY